MTHQLPREDAKAVDVDRGVEVLPAGHHLHAAAAGSSSRSTSRPRRRRRRRCRWRLPPTSVRRKQAGCTPGSCGDTRTHEDPVVDKQAPLPLFSLISHCTCVQHMTAECECACAHRLTRTHMHAHAQTHMHAHTCASGTSPAGHHHRPAMLYTHARTHLWRHVRERAEGAGHGEVRHAAGRAAPAVHDAHAAKVRKLHRGTGSNGDGLGAQHCASCNIVQ